MDSAASPESSWDRQTRITQLQARLARAESVLASYRVASQYPHESRPIAEHPDQIYPNRPVEEENVMHTADGQTDPTVRIKTSQSRVFVTAGESVTVSVAARDERGNPLPLQITRAVAKALPQPGSNQAMPQSTPSFADKGDGSLAAVVTPATDGFAKFYGGIRIEVSLRVGDHDGAVFFDTYYTPDLPAVWSGPIREALENGSLNFYLKADVRQAGRYLASGRLDDANGRPFALVTFNEELGTGQQQIRFTAFGKLIRDQKPVFPLTLRDVEAYLLKENAFPDRALMPRLVGMAYVSRNYPAKQFSDATWSSEERDRYLAEYGRDVDAAKTALDQAGGQPITKPRCPAGTPPMADCDPSAP